MSSKEAMSTLIGSEIGAKEDLHTPHRPVSARCPAETRFFCPHLGHGRITVLLPAFHGVLTQHGYSPHLRSDAETFPDICRECNRQSGHRTTGVRSVVTGWAKRQESYNAGHFWRCCPCRRRVHAFPQQNGVRTLEWTWLSSFRLIIPPMLGHRRGIGKRRTMLFVAVDSMRLR